MSLPECPRDTMALRCLRAKLSTVLGPNWVSPSLWRCRIWGVKGWLQGSHSAWAGQCPPHEPPRVRFGLQVETAELKHPILEGFFCCVIGRAAAICMQPVKLFQGNAGVSHWSSLLAGSSHSKDSQTVQSVLLSDCPDIPLSRTAKHFCWLSRRVIVSWVANNQLSIVSLMVLGYLEPWTSQTQLVLLGEVFNWICPTTRFVCLDRALRSPQQLYGALATLVN